MDRTAAKKAHINTKQKKQKKKGLRVRVHLNLEKLTQRKVAITKMLLT